MCARVRPIFVIYLSFYRKLLKSDSQDVVTQQVSAAAPLDAETKSKKPNANNKKKESTPAESVEVVGMKPAKESKKKTKSISKDEDVSVKTDSGIIDEPSESCAAKKKSKSKKQREKKAAAAMVAAQQQDQQVPESSKESQPKEKIVIDLTPEKSAQAIASAAVIAKPKDKKKKSKNSSIDQKSKDDNEKVQFDQWLAFQ